MSDIIHFHVGLHECPCRIRQESMVDMMNVHVSYNELALVYDRVVHVGLNGCSCRIGWVSM